MEVFKRKEGKKEGRKEGNLSSIQNFLSVYKWSVRYSVYVVAIRSAETSDAVAVWAAVLAVV
jgi:hypothetical protein